MAVLYNISRGAFRGGFVLGYGRKGESFGIIQHMKRGETKLVYKAVINCGWHALISASGILYVD